MRVMLSFHTVSRAVGLPIIGARTRTNNCKTAPRSLQQNEGIPPQLFPVSDRSKMTFVTGSKRAKAQFFHLFLRTRRKQHW